MWDDDLAQIAQTHAEMCVFAFNRNRGDNVGENFIVSMISPADYISIIEGWENQAADFNTLTGACLTSCTQYTQVNCTSFHC